MSRVWLIGATPVAWQYTLQQYREAVRVITDRVDNACSRATTAANNSHEHAITAARYETQALDTAAAALRDERLAKYIKVTDFFDKAVEAWAALDRVTTATEVALVAARTVSDDARRVMNSEPPASENRRLAIALAKDLFEKATRAQESAEEAAEKTRLAQAIVKDSKDAKKQDDEARKKEADNAKRAVTTAQSLAGSTAKTSSAALVAAAGAEKVRSCAGQAKAAALEGDMESAASWAAKADEAVGEVVKAEKEVALAKEEARKSLLKLQLT